MDRYKIKPKTKYKRIIFAIIILAIFIALSIILVKQFKIYRQTPEISLIGENEIKINIGDTYNDEGAKASLDGNEINVEKIGDVDTSKSGEYDIKYIAKNSKGMNKVTVIRKVIVVDNIKPEIKLNGDSDITININEEYKELGATATDNIDGDISNNIEENGSVDTSKAGKYILTYSVIDSSENVATITRNVFVKDKKTSSSNITSLPVLMYHFFYDKNKGKAKDNNWMEISDFEAQMKYLSDNDFYFPSWQEVEDFIDGKITLPEKSVVITIDDGDPSFFELAIPIIEKYNVKATSFVVTAWYIDNVNSHKSDNIIYESHSDNMHEGGSNGKGVMLSWSENKILEDVKTSSEKLNGADIFCYPFGQYNDLDKKVLKEAGYKLSFTTQGGRVKKGSDKYALPRVRMSKDMSLESFKKSVN